MAEQTMDFSTPQAAWQGLLDALEAGDSRRVAEVATPSASQQLSAATDDWSPARSRQIATEWRRWDQRWTSGGETASLALGPAEKEHHLTFRQSPTGWRLEDWQPGL